MIDILYIISNTAKTQLTLPSVISTRVENGHIIFDIIFKIDNWSKILSTNGGVGI